VGAIRAMPDHTLHKRSDPENSDENFSPWTARRRIVDAQLDEAAKRPSHGPFNTANEMIAHMKGELKKRAARRTKPNGPDDR
jgi:hypothetical protein